MSIQDVLAAYGSAWLEPDSAKRDALLEAAWSPDGTYCDPNSDVRGRAALSAHIAGFHASLPGARIELTSGASEHHGQIYFTWRMLDAGGNVAIEGVDFGHLDDTGRISQIVGFFGSPPEKT